MILFVLTMTVAVGSADKSWNKEHGHNNLVDVSGPTSHLERLEVVCSKDHMTVHMHFDHPFYGVVFSHGSPKHERCVHVGPRSGATSVSFDIRYDRCGTIEDLSGQFHENTIVIQFDEDILEAWDQAKRLRCEWLESFEKKSSKPTLAISDLDVVELNFQGDDIDCWMEVQEGKGPWARQVGGLVPIGSPLTLVIAINDHSREFDMRIKRCTASDGTGSEIELTDDRGCIVRTSLLTPFAKIRDFNGKATLVAYSHLFAFKFPDKIDVFVHCIVEVCRHGCPDSCSHQHKSYHHPGTGFDSLESKKIQKLAELAGSKPIHEIHVLGHHQHLKASAVRNEYPLPGREKFREILIPAAQTQVQQITLKNSSNVASLENTKLIKGDTKGTFSPSALKAAREKLKETKSQVQSASSNVHGIFVDIENSLHAERQSKLGSQIVYEQQEKPILTAHRIIGHDAHWISETPGKIDEVHQQQEKPILTAHRIIGHDAHWISETPGKIDEAHPPQLLKDISHHVPQSEPPAWLPDEIKPLSKPEILQQQKTQIDTNIHHYHSNTPYVSKIHWSPDNSNSQEIVDAVLKKQVPQPEPAAWTADEVKPLSKPEIFQQQKPQIHTNIHHYHSNAPNVAKIHWSPDISKSKEIVDAVLKKQVPQPEPAAWSADEVKPLSKTEILQQHKTQTGPNSQHYHPNPSYVTNIHSKEIVDTVFKKQVPLAEPAVWTLEEVNPMHSPEAIRLQLHTKPPEEPKPEPSAWSLDDVKGFNKEDLRVLSLNHKMKYNSHITPPVYKEYVNPYSTTILPQPVYISRVNPRNMSNPNMMKMMMMMSTMLPPTYQTAHWPQRTTARYLKPQRHHYPYPIPQFSPHQQMMMSVIADRRIDDEGEHLENGDLSLYHNLNSENTETEIRRIQIGDTASEPKSSSDGINITETKTLEDIKHEVELGTNSDDQISSESKITKDILKKEISESDETVVTVFVHELTTTPGTGSSKEITDEASGIRPAISSFVPPSLDTEIGVDPESKDRVVPGPRSLERRKRSSEPVFGVRQKFQAIAASDLAFEWNLTTDGAAVYRGRRAEIVYGICMSPAGMSAGVGFILILTLLSIIASVVLYEHSCQLTNKTSQLAFFTRNFNGQFEALYKFTRPYLYSGSTNVR